MKSILFFLSVLILSVSTLMAESQNLEFSLSIEEDYGIQIPDDVIRLDRFVFEYTDEAGASHLMSSSAFDAGSLQLDQNSAVITLRYYGNLSSDYEVSISGDVAEGWHIGDKILPITIEFLESDDKPEDITVREIRYGEVGIKVPATGSRESVPVVDLVLTWGGEEGLMPGEYETSMRLELSSL